MNEKTKKIVMAAAAVVIACLSFFVVAKTVSSPEFHAKTIASLNEKQETVLEMTATSTAASAAITLIPGDAGLPIAEKLTDLSAYFLIVLCALFLEKYLLTLTGYVTFKLLIPLACGLFCLYLYRKSELLKNLIARILLFSVAIVLVIPTSVQVSNLIEDTYNASVESTMESAKEATEALENSAEAEDEKGFFESLMDTVKGGVSGIIEKMETVLINFIESLAVMLVTACVIPILVLVFFVWLVKTILGVNVNMDMKKIKKRIRG